MRKALIVGIDYYESASELHGCVNDAYSVKTAVERNSDGTVNFDTKLLTCSGDSDTISRTELRESVEELFSGTCDTALFYFAGHGYIESTGGYLIASDSRNGHDGLAISDIVTFANNSTIPNRIIVLDSCHSGIAGDRISASSFAEIKEGTTILTASSAEQYASEKDGAGVFTTLFVDALNGSAANLVGEITPGSIYAHIDQSLGPWEQRPLFKTNVKQFVSLKKVQPPIALDELRKITTLFPEPGFVYVLDPTFEPVRRGGDDDRLPPPDPTNNQIFSTLQKLNRVNLVTPFDADHMWNAAIESKGCRLTVLGEHYRLLVEKNRI